MRFRSQSNYVQKCYILSIHRRGILSSLHHQVLTCAVLACVGDIICQKGVEQQKHFSTRRNAAFTSFGSLWDGPCGFCLNRAYMLLLPAWCKQTPLRQGVICTVLDNFVLGPWLHAPPFYMVTGTLQGASFHEAWAVLRVKWWPTVRTSWWVWVPAQGLNYAIVPGHFRVVFMNVVLFCWNIILDYIAHRKTAAQAALNTAAVSSPSVSVFEALLGLIAGTTITILLLRFSRRRGDDPMISLCRTSTDF
eukprot:gnl/TRDRNA2_/TRDRNA2_158844_c0_seq1.p1 gnl/TRDRNA2_/TRDRNA2_158844_c0~~gnl/TRDRNA2_/TRDRNA2_158844_c0_seq1.p1  ORF type:complete len:249 (-),score=9.86 gnl/TRDRNA2_/TRDRNA2_158844_c0_seq1:183-929(-)